MGILCFDSKAILSSSQDVSINSELGAHLGRCQSAQIRPGDSSSAFVPLQIVTRDRRSSSLVTHKTCPSDVHLVVGCLIASLWLSYCGGFSLNYTTKVVYIREAAPSIVVIRAYLSFYYIIELEHVWFSSQYSKWYRTCPLRKDSEISSITEYCLLTERFVFLLNKDLKCSDFCTIVE